MQKYQKNFVCLFLGCIFLFSCKNKNEYIKTVEIFSESPEYDLALAAYKKDIKKMDKLCRMHPEFISRSYSDRYYSVLHWTCETNNYVASKELLELGMNPDVQCQNGDTPLYSIIDTPALFPPQDLSQIALLFLSYGADCNIKTEHEWTDNEPDVYGETPFMYTAVTRFDKLKKIMIENGADINAKTRSGITAAVHCLLRKQIDYAHFLICECKADVTDEFYYNKSKPDLIRPVTLLRNLVYPLDSKEYKMKQEIIQEFKNQGLDYYSEPIPDDIKKIIKSIYPNSWEEYLKVY